MQGMEAEKCTFPPDAPFRIRKMKYTFRTRMLSPHAEPCSPHAESAPHAENDIPHAEPIFFGLLSSALTHIDL